MSYRNDYYTDGNAARKLAPKYREPQRKYKREYEFEREEYIAPSKRKNRRVQISPLYGMMVIAAIMIMAFVAVQYVSLQSQIVSLRKEKGQLISQYEELKASNDLYYESMQSSVDLKEVERVAVEELGMKMAGPGQVMTYSNDFDDYVEQYEDIPD